MKGLVVSFLGIALLLAASGCVAYSAKGNRFGSDRGLVAMDGTVYLVDYRTGNAEIIDVTDAKPFAPKPCNEANEEEQVQTAG